MVPVGAVGDVGGTDGKLTPPPVRDPGEARLLFRVRVIATVVILVLVAILVLAPVLIRDFRASEIVFASLLGALLLLLGVEGIKLFGGLGK